MARSLQARPAAPELAWIGGHRGLESQVVPEAGIPLRRLALRSLRTVDFDVHAVLDPIRLGVSMPQALALLIARRPAAIFTTGGYVAVPVLVGAGLLRIPVVMWDGNVFPGRSVRWTARMARCLTVSFEATCRGHRRPETVLPHRDADPRAPRPSIAPPREPGWAWARTIGCC